MPMITPVFVFGWPCDSETVSEIAGELLAVEDGCGSAEPASIESRAGALVVTIPASALSVASGSCVDAGLIEIGPGAAAGTGAATGAGLSIAWPHCLQKRLPGMRAVPQFMQAITTGSGTPAGSECAPALMIGSAWPHPPQKLLPATTSCPHFVQYLFDISP